MGSPLGIREPPVFRSSISAAGIVNSLPSASFRRIVSVDSSTMRETDEGLYVEGELDIQDSETAREVWGD